MPRWRRKVVSTCSRSCRRSSPWSTKMQVSRSPTARCTSTAATDESTPPDRPQITRALGPDHAPDPGDLGIDEVARGPVRHRAADLEQEVAEDLTAAGSVGHFGVELHAVQRPLLVLERGDRRVVARRGDAKPGRRHVHMVAVAHPDRGLLAPAEALEEPAAFDPDVGPAVLAPSGPADVPAREVGQHLHPVAEAQHRRAQLQQGRIGGGHAILVHRIGAAREDDAPGLPLANPLRPSARADGSRSRRALRGPAGR